MINWSKVTVIDREPDRLTRSIKEDILIRKEGPQPGTAMKAAINTVCFLGTSSSCCVKNQKN